MRSRVVGPDFIALDKHLNAKEAAEDICDALDYPINLALGLLAYPHRLPAGVVVTVDLVVANRLGEGGNYFTVLVKVPHSQLGYLDVEIDVLLDDCLVRTTAGLFFASSQTLGISSGPFTK